MNKKLQAIKYILADFFSAFTAWVSFFILRKYILQNIHEGISFTLVGGAIAISFFWIILYSISGMYNDVYRKSRFNEFIKILQFTFLGVIIIFFSLLLDDQIINYKSYYKTILLYFLLHFIITVVLKELILTHTHNLIANRKIGFRTIIIGSSNTAFKIFNELSTSSKSLGFKFIGYLRVLQDGNDQMQNHLPCLGDCNDLEKIMNENQTEEVIIAMDSNEHSQLKDIVNQLEDSSVIIKVIPDAYDILAGSVRMNHIFGTPLIEINPNLMPYWEKVIKRGIDIITSLIVLSVGCWFYLIIALIIKITSKGHIFYSQIRIGKDRKPFLIYKFRTMHTNAEIEGPALSTQDDPRITTFGKFLRKTRVDEFPQFFNVLKGDMALIGPRPERKFYIDKIEKIAPHYKHLHRVKPGITSWGQVKYGYAENVEQMVERLKYDLIYIENMSLTLDFKIMFYTIVIMIQGRGK